MHRQMALWATVLLWLSVTPMGKPPPLAVRLEKALPFRR